MLAELWMQITVLAAVAWLLLCLFVWWRRSATNLTPVDAPVVNKAAQPDFLTRDLKARDEALKRADAADAGLRAREATTTRLPVPPAAQRGLQILGLLAVVLAIVTLIAVVIAVMSPDSVVGRYVASGGTSAVKEHPISIALSVLVLAVRVCLLVVGRARSSTQSIAT